METYCDPEIESWEWHVPRQEKTERGDFVLSTGINRVTTPSNQDLKGRFARLADQWSQETGHISSVSDLIGNAKYQQIIEMGWPVVPYLLYDLEHKKRFWFPALARITGLRPFDPGDASNYQRMTDAWLRWGRRKGLI